MNMTFFLGNRGRTDALCLTGSQLWGEEQDAQEGEQWFVRQGWRWAVTRRGCQPFQDHFGRQFPTWEPGNRGKCSWWSHPIVWIDSCEERIYKLDGLGLSSIIQLLLAMLKPTKSIYNTTWFGRVTSTSFVSEMVADLLSRAYVLTHQM